MSQSRQPRGVPTGGEFAHNAHDEAAPLSDGGFDSSGAKQVHKSEIRVGDIVWDGDTGFVVSHVEHGYIGQLQRWSDPSDRRTSIALYSDLGDFWGVSANQDTVTVLRDQDALRERHDDLGEY